MMARLSVVAGPEHRPASAAHLLLDLEQVRKFHSLEDV
jgi:hypothetical protein